MKSSRSKSKTERHKERLINPEEYLLLPWELEGDLLLSLPPFPRTSCTGESVTQSEACLVLCLATRGESRPGLRCERGAPSRGSPGRGVKGLLKTLKCALRTLGAPLLGACPAESPASTPVCPERGPVCRANAGAASRGRAGPHGTDCPAAEEWKEVHPNRQVMGMKKCCLHCEIIFTK